MTRTTNARLAGAMLLLFFAAGIVEMALYGRAISGEGMAAKLASAAEHAQLIRIVGVLSLFMTVAVFVLAVTLYALTREYDRDLSLLALLCFAAQGVIGAMNAVPKLALVPIATSDNAAVANVLGSVLLNVRHLGIRGVLLFAVGSALYSWLFLRARAIAVPLAWLGALASTLLIVVLPLQLVGIMEWAWFIWIPMAVFEVTLALWLLIKGVA